MTSSGKTHARELTKGRGTPIATKSNGIRRNTPSDWGGGHDWEDREKRRSLESVVWHGGPYGSRFKEETWSDGQ